MDKPVARFVGAIVIMQEGMIGSGHQWKCVATNTVDGVTTSVESQVSFAVGMLNIQYVQMIFWSFKCTFSEDKPAYFTLLKLAPEASCASVTKWKMFF